MLTYPCTCSTIHQRHPTTQVYIDPLVVPVTNLVPYTNYTFRLFARNSLGTSTESDAWTVETLPDRKEWLDGFLCAWLTLVGAAGPGPVAVPQLIVSDARSVTVQAATPQAPNGVILKVHWC